MALITTIKCFQCGERKDVTHSARDYPTICSDCENYNINKKRKDHLDELSKLTLAQRVRKIEERLYNDALAERYDYFDRLIG